MSLLKERRVSIDESQNSVFEFHRDQAASVVAATTPSQQPTTAITKPLSTISDLWLDKISPNHNNQRRRPAVPPSPFSYHRSLKRKQPLSMLTDESIDYVSVSEIPPFSSSHLSACPDEWGTYSLKDEHECRVLYQ